MKVVHGNRQKYLIYKTGTSLLSGSTKLFIIRGALEMHSYSKTCLKRLLYNRQNKDLNDNWKLNEG